MESFGAHLKREREQRKISLEDVSLSTKIGTRFLQALEEEHFDLLPGGIFNKGFVRAYARHLGLDEDQIVADFLAASGTAQPDPKAEEILLQELRGKETSRENDAEDAVHRVPWGTVALVLLAVALGFAVWGFRSREKSPAEVRAEHPVKAKVVAAPQNAGPELKSVAASTPAPEIGRAPASDNATPAPANSSAQTAQTPATPNPAPQAPATPVTAPEAAAKSVELASANAPVPPVQHAGPFVVLVKAREDAWVSITADGKPVMEDTLVAPSEKAIQARNQVVIKTGNAAALDFSFNGKKLPQQGEFGEVKTLTFGTSGLQRAPAKAQPGSN